MSTLREAAEQALNALDRVQPQVRGAIPQQDVEDAIDALRDALGKLDKTHSDECYQWHHACAIAEILRLREANDEAYSRGIDAGWALAQQSKAVQERNSGYTEEYAANVAAYARREEREACAKVCEVHGSMAKHAVWMAEECAALIRARGNDE